MQAQPADGRVRRRLAYHIGGFDPFTPHDGAHRRFGRELQRFQSTWSIRTHLGPVIVSADETCWTIEASGPNWQVSTDFRVLRWDDVISAMSRQPPWRRAVLGSFTFFDFVFRGALVGYMRTSWQYTLFFLYPFGVSAALIAVALAMGWAVGAVTGSAMMGLGASVVATTAAILGPWRWLDIKTLFDDWIFADTYIRGSVPDLDGRLDRIAKKIVADAKGGGFDEIVVVGHSLGAVLAIDLIDRALALDPSLGATSTPVTFLSIGASILKVGLHNGATRFRAAVTRLTQAPGILWGDYQARADVMNFYGSDPVVAMGLPKARNLIVRLVKIRHMLDPVVYRRIRLRLFRVHCQFISGNDRRAAYDYFMILCGPIAAAAQTLTADGALSMIGADGTLLTGAAGGESRTART